MKFERDDIRFRTFEQHISTSSETRKLSTQNEVSPVQLAGDGRLSKHEQRLQYAAFPHSVQTAKESHRGECQLQAVETLEVRDLDLPEHHRHLSMSRSID